jgi:hypothetical protein
MKAQIVMRRIALVFLFHLSTRRGWVVNATPRPPYPEKESTLRFVQEAGLAPEPVLTGTISLASTRIRFPDLSASSESLYRLRSFTGWATLIINEHTRFEAVTRVLLNTAIFIKKILF